MTGLRGARIRRDGARRGNLPRLYLSQPEARRRNMAEKKAKTAEKGGDVGPSRKCPRCQAETRVVQFAGFGPRGFFWVCEKNCGFTERTR